MNNRLIETVVNKVYYNIQNLQEKKKKRRKKKKKKPFPDSVKRFTEPNFNEPEFHRTSS